RTRADGLLRLLRAGGAPAARREGRAAEAGCEGRTIGSPRDTDAREPLIPASRGARRSERAQIGDDRRGVLAREAEGRHRRIGWLVERTAARRQQRNLVLVAETR